MLSRCVGAVALMALLPLAVGCGDSQDSGAAVGITVVGHGTASAPPDAVTLRLSIGSQGPFGFPRAVALPRPEVVELDREGFVEEVQIVEPQFQLITEEQLEPVFQALRDNGVSSEEVVVSPFGTEFFGLQAGAQLGFSWPRPSQLDQIVSAVQTALREQGQYSLQSVQAIFTVDDCELLESEALEQALLDARSRAELLAQASGVRLGPVVAISEGPALPFPFGSLAEGGCAAMEQATISSFVPELTGRVNSPSVVEVSESVQVTYRLED